MAVSGLRVPNRGDAGAERVRGVMAKLLSLLRLFVRFGFAGRASML